MQERRQTDSLLFLCGLILALTEVYKQLFIYYIENNGRYDWWYFPFQLCSIPMYLGLLILLFRKNLEIPFTPLSRISGFSAGSWHWLSQAD